VQEQNHAFGHLCFFVSCPLEACRQAQKDAELYGFNTEAEINLPPPKAFPWELDAA
jgi:hypothetical protein